MNIFTCLGLSYPLYIQYHKNNINEVLIISLILGVNIGMILKKAQLYE